MSRVAPLSEQVRSAIELSGMSCAEICKATGIDKATMSRMMSGERWLHVRAMNAIGELLGLEIVARNRKGGSV